VIRIGLFGTPLMCKYLFKLFVLDKIRPPYAAGAGAVPGASFGLGFFSELTA